MAEMNRDQTRAELDRITELETQVNGLLKNLSGIRAQQQMRMGFGTSDIHFSPVMLLVERNGCLNKSPRRCDFPAGLEGKVVFKQAYQYWCNAAVAQAEKDIEAAKKILRKNKIPFRAGKDYQWPVLRLV